ncbi:MAG: hypothetical protein AAB267_05760 [Candidatus Desantisbacteria bacterium]
MEAIIQKGQIYLPEEVLEKTYLPREGRVKLLVGEREIRIFLPSLKKEVVPNAVMKIIKHLEGPHPRCSIEDMAADSEVDLD